MSSCRVGSPPHRRGKVFLTDLVRVVVRITPAQAGKRSGLQGWQSPAGDHPRVGREKARTLIVQDEPQGSPPRRRGKGIQLTHKGLLDGITPAWAGKRWRCIPCFCIRWDHPRVGGEK